MIPHISVQELKEKMENSTEKDKFVLIDCREVSEWEQGHIPTAQLVPLSTLAESFQNLKKHQQEEKEIIIYCRSGQRSLRAAMFLQENGFTHTTNVKGGILDWVEEGYEIEHP